ncbi:MAG: hypothetical protein HC938_13625 [Nitrospira sp.]|nr:hypothetical protein [Nitrospira sp.]
MIHPALFLMIALVSAGLVAAPVQAATVTQLELTGGAVNFGGAHHEMMDRLLGQEGTLKLGQYQAIGEIVPSIGKSCETFSLFTSGFSGASAPSAPRSPAHRSPSTCPHCSSEQVVGIITKAGISAARRTVYSILTHVSSWSPGTMCSMETSWQDRRHFSCRG